MNDTTTLSSFLASVGAESRPRPAAMEDPGLVAAGKEMIYEGKLPNSEGKRLSEYFFCADCHSPEREEETLFDPGDASARAEFAIKNDLPLLPGPTFAGITDRLSFFETEFSDSFNVPEEAHASLEKAVQFCSSQIAKGRPLNPVEMQAVLAYLYSLEWRIGDLGFRGADLAELKRRSLNRREHRLIVEDLRKRYAVRASGSRGDLPRDPGTGYTPGTKPDPERGRQLWFSSCLHCHDADGASQHYFGDRPATWKELLTRFEDGTVYRHIREGSGGILESGIHMPPFPVEKLGNREIEDLRAYVRTRAGVNPPGEGGN